jgi:hypothetical protein
MSETKERMIERIYATIRKRDVIKRGMLDDKGDFLPWARVLMHDLGKFCYMNKTHVKVSKLSGRIDPIASAVAEGRREVYLRIIEILNFTDENALKMIEQLNQREE